jgi:predicted enzyme related to lactoylglutathione lyase
MDRVSFFEFATPDPAREKAFFSDVFGWEVKQWGDQDYWLVTTGSADKPGIDGAIQPPPMADAPRVVNTITVDDIDATIEKAKSAGAMVVVEKMEVEGMGTLAYLMSPTGIPFGVMQMMPGAMM